MSGVTPLIDTLLATRLAQRVDLVPLKGALEIADPDAAARVEKVINEVRLPSRAALQRQLGPGLHAAGGEGRSSAAPLTRSGDAVTLSAVARAVSAILDPRSGPVPKILGSEPLWPHPHHPPVATTLTAALARTVAHSGLFYESHLRQYAAGVRSRAQLAQEPQARLGAMDPRPLDLPGARVAGQDPGSLPMARMAQPASALPGAADGASEAHAETRSVARPGAAGATIDGAQASAAPAPNPWPIGLASRLDPAHLGAIYGLARAHDHEPLDDMAGQESPATKPGASPLDAVRGSALVPPGIHPDALALVRQQLELLAVPVFRWGGEAWPGAPMDWEIQQESDERPAADESEAVPPAWSTRLSITLPTLKTVDVRVRLAGSTLQVHLAASEKTTVALLGEGGHELPQRLAALGLQLGGMQVGVLAPEPAAPTPGKDDDAAHRA